MSAFLGPIVPSWTSGPIHDEDALDAVIADLRNTLTVALSDVDVVDAGGVLLTLDIHDAGSSDATPSGLQGLQDTVPSEEIHPIQSEWVTGAPRKDSHTDDLRAMPGSLDINSRLYRVSY